MPPDEGLWRHIHQGLFPSKPVGEQYQDISRYIVETSWSNFTLLVEGELFSQEEVFCRQRGTGSCTSGKKMHVVREEHANEMRKLTERVEGVG